MDTITDKNINDFTSRNTIVGNPRLVNSKIIFKGTNNILYFAQSGITLKDSTIDFQGSNSVVFLCENTNTYLVKLSIYNDSVCYIGKNCYINNHLQMIISERKHVIIGNDGLFSTNCCFRTADPHLMYDCESNTRINHSNSIYIGDHVWLGQQALLLKGTQIGSGSIIGAMSVVSNKIIPSNCSFAGNPVKLVRAGVFFSKNCVHKYSVADTQKTENGDFAREFIYTYDQNQYIPFNVIDSTMDTISQPSERLEYLISTIYNNNYKNRFDFDKYGIEKK